MAGKQKLNAAKKRSRDKYNIRMMDLVNKERKLKKHLKKHPNDKLVIDTVIANYISKRRR